MRQTEETNQRVQTKDDRISKIREETEPVMKTARKNLDMVDDMKKVTAQIVDLIVD